MEGENTKDRKGKSESSMSLRRDRSYFHFNIGTYTDPFRCHSKNGPQKKYNIY